MHLCCRSGEGEDTLGKHPGLLCPGNPTDSPGVWEGRKDGERSKTSKTLEEERKVLSGGGGEGGEQGREREDYCSAELEGALQLP